MFFFFLERKMEFGLPDAFTGAKVPLISNPQMLSHSDVSPLMTSHVCGLCKLHLPPV